MPGGSPAQLRVGVLGDPGALAASMPAPHISVLRAGHMSHAWLGLHRLGSAAAAKTQAWLWLCCHQLARVVAGQTYNTSLTLEHLAASRPDVVLFVGDLSYAVCTAPITPPSPEPQTRSMRWRAGRPSSCEQ
jgi:hypothetical protein